MVAVLSLGGCGSGPAAAFAPAPADSTCQGIFEVDGMPPSQVDAARQGQLCQPQALTLSGELSGSIRSAYLRDAAGPCSTPNFGDSWQLPALDFALDGRAYELDLAPAGRYLETQASVDLSRASLSELSGQRNYWAARSGSVTVNDAGVAGTISADFLRDAAGAQPVHLTGHWSCGAAPAFKAADPTVPCGQYYLDAGLATPTPPDERSCRPQDLFLTGALSFHVDHGINGAASAPGSPLDPVPVNVCGLSGRSYFASVAFSHRRETFVLGLGVRSTSPFTDPSFAPGTFGVTAALNQSPAPFAVLQLARVTADGITLLEGPAQSWDASSGSFMVASDLRSGTANLVFRNNAIGQVQLSGSWRCG